VRAREKFLANEDDQQSIAVMGLLITAEKLMWNENFYQFIVRSNRRLTMVWKWLATALLIWILWGILQNYPFYFPPDFTAPFLLNHEADFRGLYGAAFFAHIVSSPVALVCGLFLVSSHSRRWLPKIHKLVGRVQVANVCLAVAPSGFVMSFYALGGFVSSAAFLCLSVLTCTTALLGFWHARQQRFEQHQRWMWRCWILLSSAIVLRLMAMAAEPFGLEPVGFYRFTAWASWLLPLIILELSVWLQRCPTDGENQKVMRPPSADG
jgi:uncharacterized membrane protein